MKPLRLLHSNLAVANHNVDFIENFLAKVSDHIRTLGSHYPKAIRSLLERNPDPSDELSQRLALYLTRSLLLDYYFGCLSLSLASHRPAPILGNAFTDGRQQRSKELLGELTRFKICRQTMATYFAAALQKRLHPLLRRDIQVAPTTFAYLLHPIAFADDLEKLSESGMFFGLNGFFLLFRAEPDSVPSDEFELLFHYAHRLVRDGDWQSCINVIQVLSAANLSQDRQNQLLDFVQSILDLNQFPYKDPEKEAITWIEEKQFSPAFTRILKTLAAKKDDQSDKWAQARNAFQPVREHNSFIFRQEAVISMLSLLALKNQAALEVLQNITLQALKQHQEDYPNMWRRAPPSDVLKAALECLLLLAASHVQALETLHTYQALSGKTMLTDKQIEYLNESDLRLSAEPAEYLLNMMRSTDTPCQWAEQMIEHVPALEYETVDIFKEVASTEQDIRILRVLTRCCQRHLERRSTQITPLQSALTKRLKKLLFDPTVPLEADWITFLSQTPNREPLRQVLDQAIDFLSGEADSLRQSRSKEVLYMIGQKAYQIPKPDAVTLAACWLLDPTDQIQNNLPLADRAQEAKRIFLSPRNPTTGKRIVEILDSAVTHNHLVQEATARSLRSFSYPDIVIALLEKLMDTALFRRNAQLYREAFKSLASLSPLTSQTLRVLQERLTLSYDIDNPSPLPPQVFYEEVLPLVPHRVDPQSVESLIEMVWQCHCPICSQTLPMTEYKKSAFGRYFAEQLHRYLHREPEIQEAEESLLLYALQALTHVTTLSPFQQWVIKRLWRTSWRAPVKTRTLLILSRQQSSRVEILPVLVHTLAKNPLVSYYSIAIKDVLRYYLFRWFRQRYPAIAHYQYPSNAHCEYLFLCQSIAAFELPVFLQELEPGTKSRRRMIKILLKSVSLFRHLVEQELIRETSMAGSITKQISLSGITLPISDSPDETSTMLNRPSDLPRPSDLAYEILRPLNLSAEFGPTKKEWLKNKLQAWFTRTKLGFRRMLKRKPHQV